MICYQVRRTRVPVTHYSESKALRFTSCERGVSACAPYDYPFLLSYDINYATQYKDEQGSCFATQIQISLPLEMIATRLKGDYF